MRVSVIGHRKAPEGPELVVRIYETLFDLIVNQGVDTFYFGSKSRFDTFCFEAVMELRHSYPHVKTVYVRANYEHIEKSYEDYLLESYDETYYPDTVRDSHELCYVIRDAALVEVCDVLLTYCATNYEPPRKTPKNKMMAPVETAKKPKSGTQMAVLFAKKRKKRIINLFR